MVRRKNGMVVISKVNSSKKRRRVINNAIWNDCPKCSFIMRRNKKFCSNCGFKLVL